MRSDDHGRFVNEVRAALSFLQFEPNVREAQVYLPPLTDDATMQTVAVDWYHDPGDGVKRRWAWRWFYPYGEGPDLLSFRRAAAFNAAAMFVPWSSRLGFLRALWEVAPEGTWMDAVIALIMKPIIECLAAADSGNTDDRAYHQEMVSSFLKNAQAFVDKLNDEIAFRAAVLEVQKVNDDSSRGD